MLKRIIDFVFPWCPSGMPHRVRMGVVTNVFGKKYCWHRDCTRANFAECRLPDPIEGMEQRLARLEREHFGDPDKETGIYAPRNAGVKEVPAYLSPEACMQFAEAHVAAKRGEPIERDGLGPKTPLRWPVGVKESDRG